MLIPLRSRCSGEADSAWAPTAEGRRLGTGDFDRNGPAMATLMPLCLVIALQYHSIHAYDDERAQSIVQ